MYKKSINCLTKAQFSLDNERKLTFNKKVVIYSENIRVTIITVIL